MSSFELWGSWAMAGAALLRAAAAFGSSTVAAPLVPRPIEVPAPLQARNATIEPSGLVWAAPLDRYLVVSDDTGQYADRHAPFVLAMSRTGAFDAEPVPLVGVEELNDPEAICPGPDGTFFLTTSHSPNKRGHTRPARRQLLWLKLVKRSLEVAGRVDLTTAQAADGRDIRAIAGVAADGRLDIEALTFAEGALFVGLKSPLTAEGNAVVLRLAEPTKVLAAGRIPTGALSRAATLALAVAGPKGPVAQGISDLLALPNGDWLVTANAPKGGPPDGGGAIFHYRPGTSPAVKLLSQFPGLKPEGVALAADGKSWALVFDNDVKPPSWILTPPLTSSLAASLSSPSATPVAK